MTNEVAPEMPPAYDSVAKDDCGMPLAGETPPADSQTEQQQQYADYCAQPQNPPTIIAQGEALPEGAVIVQQPQQPQIVVVQQPGVGANYCVYCQQHVS